MAIGELYREGRRAAAFGLALSLGLGSIKLAGGLLGHSYGLVSDAAHSLVDAFISGALVVALGLAQRPPDREHPYGHARVETLAGLGVALLLIAMGIGIARGALVEFHGPKLRPEWFTLAIAVGGAIVQEGLYQRTSRIARRTGSAALLATAWDYRLDALGSIAVLVGVAASRLGGPAFAWTDGAAALAVSTSILWVGSKLLGDNVQGLMDRQADPEVLDAFRAAATEVAGVREVETLRVRRAGIEYLVDIHVEVDPAISVSVGHEIAHRVKDHLLDSVPSVRDVLVHVEPHGEPPRGPRRA